MNILTKIIIVFVALIYPGYSAADRVLGYAKVDTALGEITGYNSDGRGVFLTKSNQATGSYTIMFEGLVSHSVFGYTQAVRIGTSAGYCKVTQTSATGGTLAEVQCFEPDGTFAASPHSFDLLYLANTEESTESGSERLSYFFANQSGEGSYEVSNYLGYNSNRGRIKIVRNSVGRYTATVPGMAETGEVGANVQVVARGAGNSVCTLGGWAGSESQPADLEIDIRCFSPESVPRDSQFQAMIVQADGLPDDIAYTYSTQSGNTVTQDLVKYYTHTSVETGEVYRGDRDNVVFAPLGRAFGSITLVTPHSTEPRICQIARSDFRSASPTRLLPPVNDLIVDPLCSLTRSSGGTATDGFSMLSISPEQMYQPQIGERLVERKYPLTIEILRIREKANGYCDKRYLVDRLRTPDHVNPLFGPSSLTFDSRGDVDVKTDWYYSFNATTRDNRYDVHLHKYFAGFSCFGSSIDITPALDQTHLTLNVDLQTHTVSTIFDNDWLFTGFHFFGYIGETLTVNGTEGLFPAEITFRITLGDS